MIDETLAYPVGDDPPQARLFYIGIDLNEDYIEVARCRIEGRKVTPSKREAPEVSILDLFGEA